MGAAPKTAALLKRIKTKETLLRSRRRTALDSALAMRGWSWPPSRVAAPGWCSRLRERFAMLGTAAVTASTAMDVGVASPNAAAADADCTQSMMLHKRDEHLRHAYELNAQGVE